MKPNLILIMLCALLLPGWVFSQGSTDTIVNSKAYTIAGSIRGFAFAGSEGFDYSCAFSEAGIKADAMLRQSYNFRADIRFRYGYQFNSETTVVDIREAYAGFSSKPVDVSIGKKVLDWSRVDAFSVSNKVTPTDYFYFSPENDDQKLSQWMLHARLKLGNKITWQVAAIPFYTPSVYRFDLFDMGENAAFDNAVLPERSFGNGSVATRLKFDLNKIGFAFSYFEGYSTEYGFNLTGIDFFSDPVVAQLKPVYHRMRSASFDFELPLERWIFRGECAYNQIKDTGNYMYLPKNGLHYVLAIERSFFDIVVSAEYIGHYTLDFEPFLMPANYLEEMIYQLFNFNRQIFYQQKEANHAVALILSRSFLQNTIQADLATYYNISSEEFTVRPQVSYAINDNLKVSLGGMYMKGPEKSIFSYSSKIMNGVFIQLKASF